MKTFPLIVTGIFVFLALAGFIAFATFSSKGSSSSVGNVVIWGSVPTGAVAPLIESIQKVNHDYDKVSYVEVPRGQLSSRLVEAIASGRGPDLILLPEEELLSEGNKLQVIPYSVISRRDFQNTFIQDGENFLTPEGMLGIPFTIDPMVMYWNRTLFSNAGIAEPPTYWDEIADLAPKLAKANTNGTLVQSAVALGTWTNVNHAKEIFLTLLSQLGNPVIAVSAKGKLSITLLDNPSQGATLSPAESALRFYAQFGDPTQRMYSWNRSQPNSRDVFIGGSLAIYFGYASELGGIRASNPNLNFDVAPMPKIRGGGQGAYGAISAFSVPRGSANPTGAINVAKALTGQTSQAAFADSVGLPPVRRDISPGKASDPYIVIFRNASLTAFSFLDPNPDATDSIFQRMVDNVTSGKFQISEAVAAGAAELAALLGVQ